MGITSPEQGGTLSARTPTASARVKTDTPNAARTQRKDALVVASVILLLGVGALSLVASSADRLHQPTAAQPMPTQPRPAATIFSASSPNALSATQ